MTLELAVEIGKDNGLNTLHEVIRELIRKKDIFFEFSDSKEEIAELLEEIKDKGLTLREKVDIIKNERLGCCC